MSDLRELRVRIYFPPSTPIERMEFERADFASRSQKRAEHDAQVLRDYDARIAEMKAEREAGNVKTAV